MGLQKSEVIEHNMPYVVFNWIKFVCWNEKSISSAIKDTHNYHREMKYINIDITDEEARTIVVNYVKSLVNERRFNEFIERLKFTYIAKSFKNLMNESELDFRNKKQLHDFIIENIMPII